MHKIAEKEFTMKDFSCEHLNRIGTSTLWEMIDILNTARTLYLEGGNYKGQHYDAKNKDIWWQLIQLLPSSYNQTRNVMLNYEVLANIYKSRKDHKLDEWREFCEWIKTLSHYELITGCTDKNMTPDKSNTLVDNSRGSGLWQPGDKYFGYESNLDDKED